MALMHKNIIVAKSKEAKTECNLAESSGRLWLQKGCSANDDDSQKTKLTSTNIRLETLKQNFPYIQQISKDLYQQ
jgi:hypothetical protein